MSPTVPNVPAFLSRPSYIARVTRRDGRATELALAGETLFGGGASLDGAMIEATYALSKPPLLKRLGDDGVLRIVDPQSPRFVGRNFTETQALMALPYAPERQITSHRFVREQARDLARGALDFAQQTGVDAYIAPGLPMADDDLDRWVEHNTAILGEAVAYNGSRSLPRRPLLAMMAPGPKALARPQQIVDHLLDHPVDGVYLIPTTLNPTKASVEKLAQFVQFAFEIMRHDIPVMVGRVGAFGLVLQALGITAFDSGLGQAEKNDLASLNRPITDKERERRASGESSAGGSRTYLEQLKTTVDTKTATSILKHPDLGHEFVCARGCCQFHTAEDLGARSRAHYLWTRRAEVDLMREVFEVPAMRLHHIEQQITAARDLADRVARHSDSLHKLPSLEHLTTWMALLAREQPVLA